MADFFLHTQLIEDIYNAHQTYKHLEVAKIGAQGPDPFYYVIKKGISASSHMLADLMHDEKINDFLIALTDEVKAQNDEILKAYLIGFITHFILDVNIHPYIYYFTGEYIESELKTHIYRGYHLRFERSVDISYIRHRYQKNPIDFHLRKRIVPLKEVPNQILELHKNIALKVYEQKHADMKFDSGYHTMRMLLKLLIKDVTGLKKIILSIADMFSKTSPIFLKDYPYHKKDRSYDYLNLDHHPWHHPITNETYTFSVLDIYDQAYKEAAETIKEVLAYLDGKEVDLKSLFKNRSFNSGIDTSKERTMKYFKLFDKK